MTFTKIDVQPDMPLANKLRPTFRSGAVARMLFEKALEQVAIAEGLPLPLVPTASSL